MRALGPFLRNNCLNIASLCGHGGAWAQMLGSAYHKFQRVNSVTLSCDCMVALWACSAGMLPESPVRLGEAQHKVARNAISFNTLSCNDKLRNRGSGEERGG